jgi:hypothetical protein
VTALCSNWTGILVSENSETRDRYTAPPAWLARVAYLDVPFLENAARRRRPLGPNRAELIRHNPSVRQVCRRSTVCVVKLTAPPRLR